MKVLLGKDFFKRYFPSIIKPASSLFLLIFLSASMAIGGVNFFFSPSAAEAQGPPKVILNSHEPHVRAALDVHHRYKESLLGMRDVVGTGVGIGTDGLPMIKIFTSRTGVKGIPKSLESIPVEVEMTGMVMALSDPAGRFARPVPIGVSTGHPAITAGTIGCRVTKGTDVYALSNNHVYANSNSASLGDNVLQPGAYDGGMDPADRIGVLADFQPIDFSGAANYIDAAIAKSSMDLLSNSTQLDGYGIPNSVTKEAAIGLPVQKYGRTTGLTRGQVSEIDVTVNVCYETWWNFCLKSARFEDQIAITAGDFSAGGDSGSLIVTDDQNKNPVGLLFAGGSNRTFANRINLVLDRFGVQVDDGGPVANFPPTADFSYTTSGLTVSFTDKSTDSDGTISSRNWNFGDGSASMDTNPTHTYAVSGTYTVTLTVTDNKGATGTKNQMLTLSLKNVHVGDLDGSSAKSSLSRWKAKCTITVHDVNHNPMRGARVTGKWSTGTLSSSCTTGTNGQCSITSGQILNSTPSATFTVNNLTYSTMPYNPAANHDPDVDSDGTSITIFKPYQGERK